MILSKNMNLRDIARSASFTFLILAGLVFCLGYFQMHAQVGGLYERGLRLFLVESESEVSSDGKIFNTSLSRKNACYLTNHKDHDGYIRGTQKTTDASDFFWWKNENQRLGYLPLFKGIAQVTSRNSMNECNSNLGSSCTPLNVGSECYVLLGNSPVPENDLPTCSAEETGVDLSEVTLTWDNSSSGDNNVGVVSVFADLSSIGEGSRVAMFDDGLSGDGLAGDQIYGVQVNGVKGVGGAVGFETTITAQGALSQNPPPLIVSDEHTMVVVETERDPLGRTVVTCSEVPSGAIIEIVGTTCIETQSNKMVCTSNSTGSTNNTFDQVLVRYPPAYASIYTCVEKWNDGIMLGAAICKNPIPDNGSGEVVSVAQVQKDPLAGDVFQYQIDLLFEDSDRSCMLSNSPELSLTTSSEPIKTGDYCEVAIEAAGVDICELELTKGAFANAASICKSRTGTTWANPCVLVADPITQNIIIDGGAEGGVQIGENDISILVKAKCGLDKDLDGVIDEATLIEKEGECRRAIVVGEI